MKKKLILISGSPCVGKTEVGMRLFERYENSAYLDGDWCWCVNPFSVTDKRVRNGDKNMSFILSNYLNSDFEYVFFTSVVLTDPDIRKGIIKNISAENFEIISFTMTCSEETLNVRHYKRGDEGSTNYYWLHLPPNKRDIVIDTDYMEIEDTVDEMMHYIDSMDESE